MKKTLISLGAFVFMLACMTVALAQNVNTITGRVTDPQGAGVTGATIKIYARDNRVPITTISDATGAYRFERLEPGEYIVEIESPGFARSVQPLRAERGRVTTFNVSLEIAGVSSEVVVTADGTPQSTDEVAKAISVVDAKQIERRDEYSLIGALRPVPGLRVEQLGGPGAFSKIFIRGLRVVDSSLLVDGFRVRDAADFRGSINPFLEDLLTNNMDRVEVLRGSGSSLYGSNAVGGVVNIVPTEGAGSPKFNLGFEGGSLGLFRERAQVSGGIRKKFGYSFSVTRLGVNHGVHDIEVYRNTSLAGHARYQIRPNISLRGTIVYTRGFNRLSDSPFPIGPAGNEFGFATGSGPVTSFVENEPDPDSFRRARLFTGSIAFSHQLNTIYGYSVSFQSVATHRLFNNGPAQSKTAARLGLFADVSDFLGDGRTQTFNFTNNIRAGRHNLISVGLEAEREQFTQSFTSPFFSTPQTTDRQRSLAFFAQDQLSLLDGRLQFSTSFRTQSFTIKNPQSVPEVQNIDVKRAIVGDGSIAYRWRESGTKLRAHVGNSFRAPSLSERFVLFRGQRIGNPFLRPERGLSVDGGIDQTLLNNRLRASATYFYSRLQEVITSTALFKQTNAPGALARGVELSVAASAFRGMDISSAYTFTNSSQGLSAALLRSDNVRLPKGASIQSFSIPRHSFSLEVNQRFRKRFNVNFDLYAVSKHNFPLFDPVFFSQVLFTFKGYTKAAVGASYKLPLTESRSLRFYGKLDNLLGQKYLEEGFRAPGRTGVAGAVFSF